MQAVIKHPRKFLRGFIPRQIGPADVADKQRVPGEHSPGFVAPIQVYNYHRNALYRMSRSLEEPKNHAAETDLIAIVHRLMRQRRIGRRTQVNFRARARSQFDMSADEIGVQMSLDDVLDL